MEPVTVVQAVGPGAARGIGGQDRGQVEALPRAGTGRGRARPRPAGRLRFTATCAPHSGLGLLTGQSLPAHSSLPASCSERNGYCQPARRSPRNGMVSSSICGSCVAHSGWMFAVARQPAEARDVVRVDDLQVGQVVPPAVPSAGPPGRLHRVQGVADRAVAQRVEMDLEALAVERGHEAGKLVRVDEVQAAVLGGAPVTVEVGLEHGGRVALGDAVEHHLHAGGPEPPGLPGVPGAGAARGAGPGRGSRSHHSAPTTLASRVPARAARR